MCDQISVGQRLQVDEYRATVLYIGPVEGQRGEWAGLEWDDHTRGKHDGSHGGKRYFATQRSNKSGSFVRLEKLRESAKRPSTVLQALQDKYEREQTEAGTSLNLTSRVRVELVGMAKLRQQRGGIERLQEVSLQDVAISSAGPEGELNAHAASIEDLDVSGNLLANWEEAERLCQELPRLHTLNLSCNLMQFARNRQKGQYSGMRQLVLNGCGLTFSQAMSLLPSLPCLEELYLGNNSIKGLDFDPADSPATARLEALGLEDNCIGDWGEVCRLDRLSNLQRLHLGGNQLRQISYPQQSPGQPVPFPSLRALLIGQNQLTEWQYIDACDQFPCLSQLRLTGNPHPAEEPSNRFEVIARIGKLKVLNGSIISAVERKECEVQYLRESAARNLESNSEAVDGKASMSHASQSRLKALRERYGDIGAASRVATAPKTLGDDMLTVHLSGKSAAGQEVIFVKKLPGSITVGRLKLLCSKLFKLQASKMCLIIDLGGLKEDVSQQDTKDLAAFSPEEVLRIEVGHTW